MLKLWLFHWLSAVGLRQVDIIGPVSDLPIVGLVQDHARGSKVHTFVHMHHWVLKLLIVLFLFLLHQHDLSIFLGAGLERGCARSDMAWRIHVARHWAFLCAYWLILIDIVANRALATSNWNGANWHVEIGFVHFVFFLGTFFAFFKTLIIIINYIVKQQLIWIKNLLLSGFCMLGLIALKEVEFVRWLFLRDHAFCKSFFRT